MKDSGIILLGFAVAFMVGMLGAGIRAVILAVSRRGHTDFWNINEQ